jgi:hypothetical protein
MLNVGRSQHVPSFTLTFMYTYRLYTRETLYNRLILSMLFAHRDTHLQY